MKGIILILITVAVFINGQVIKLDLGDRVIEINKNILTSWDNAYQACASRGLELLTIHSIEENYNIITFLNTNKITGNFWTAGADLYESGIYRWMVNGEKLSVDFWADGQPDNYAGKDHCLYFTVAASTNANINWFDGICSTANRYFCQTKRTTLHPARNLDDISEEENEIVVKELAVTLDKMLNYRTIKRIN